MNKKDDDNDEYNENDNDDNKINEHCNCRPTNICSAFNNCHFNKKCCEIQLNIYNDHKKDFDLIPNNLNISINARVVEDIHYDIIIGLPTIRKYKLTRYFSELFEESEKSDPENLEQKTLKDELVQEWPKRIAVKAENSHYSPPTTKTCVNNVTRKLVTVTVDTETQLRALGLRMKPIGELVNYIASKTDLLGTVELEDDGIDMLLRDNPYDNIINKENNNKNINSIKLFGSEELQSKLRTEILDVYTQTFQTELMSEPAVMPEFDLRLNTNNNWFSNSKNKQPARKQTSAKDEAIQDFVTKALKAGIIEESQATSWSHVHLTPKPNGRWRFCIDYRSLNQNTESLGLPIPNIVNRNFSGF